MLQRGEEQWKKYRLIKQHGYLKVSFDGKAKEKIGVLIGDILDPVTKWDLKDSMRGTSKMPKIYDVTWQILIDIWETINYSTFAISDNYILCR